MESDAARSKSSQEDTTESIPDIVATPVLKVLVLGEAGCGKTSFIKRFIYADFFSPEVKTTVGVDYLQKRVTTDRCSVKLQLWDIAGQERFGAISRIYYKDALGALLLFDVTKSRDYSLRTIAAWKQEINDKILLPNGKPIPIVLVGTKSDLATRFEMATIISDRSLNNTAYPFIKSFVSSSKEGINIIEPCECIAEKILEIEDIFFKDHAEHGVIRPATYSRPVGGSSCC